jgi:predicted RNA binding protein with dsRBD fold (UPF0201 family)
MAMVIVDHIHRPTMPRVDGISQGISVVVSTTVESGEDHNAIVEALCNLFPDFPTHNMPERNSFPINRETIELKAEGLSMTHLLELAAQERVLDTALDSMSMRIGENATKFRLSRQAALAGKVSFAVLGEVPLGGTIAVTLSGEELGEWLQEATWHPGREQVPREINDDLSMRGDGHAITWLS